MFSCILDLCCFYRNSFGHNIVPGFVVGRNIVLHDLFRHAAFLHTIVAVFLVRRNIIGAVVIFFCLLLTCVVRFFFCLLLTCLRICEYGNRKHFVDEALNPCCDCFVGCDVDNMTVVLHPFKMGSQASCALVPIYTHDACGKFTSVVGVELSPPSLVALA